MPRRPRRRWTWRSTTISRSSSWMSLAKERARSSSSVYPVSRVVFSLLKTITPLWAIKMASPAFSTSRRYLFSLSRRAASARFLSVISRMKATCKTVSAWLPKTLSCTSVSNTLPSRSRCCHSKVTRPPSLACPIRLAAKSTEARPLGCCVVDSSRTVLLRMVSLVPAKSAREAGLQSITVYSRSTMTASGLVSKRLR